MRFSSIKFNSSNLLLHHSASVNFASIKTLIDGISTSMGRTASMPYTREKGVAPVEVRTVTMKSKREHFMSIFVSDDHLLNDFLDVFVSCFYNSIHLWSVR